MSILKVLPFLKKGKTVMLYRDEQSMPWLGDYHAMYNLYDMPNNIELDAIIDMMGMTERERGSIIEGEHVFPGVKNYQDWEETSMMIPVVFRYELYHVLITSSGAAACVPARYLKPIERDFDVKKYRISGDRDNVIVENGIFPVALITSARLWQDEDFMQMIGKLESTMGNMLFKDGLKGQGSLDFEEDGDGTEE